MAAPRTKLKRPKLRSRNTAPKVDSWAKRTLIEFCGNFVPPSGRPLKDQWFYHFRNLGFREIKPRESGPFAWEIKALLPEDQLDMTVRQIRKEVCKMLRKMGYKLLYPGMGVRISVYHRVTVSVLFQPRVGPLPNPVDLLPEIYRQPPPEYAMPV